MLHPQAREFDLVPDLEEALEDAGLQWEAMVFLPSVNSQDKLLERRLFWQTPEGDRKKRESEFFKRFLADPLVPRMDKGARDLRFWHYFETIEDPNAFEEMYFFIVRKPAKS